MTVDTGFKKPFLPGIGLTQKSLCEPAIEASASPEVLRGGSLVKSFAADWTWNSYASSRSGLRARAMLLRADGPQRQYISMALGT